jgi:hypothetical protein
MVPPADLDDFSPSDLKSLVPKLFEEVAELRRTVAAQRDEIARLKGGPGRPNIKPSGMDKVTEPKGSRPAGGEPRRKGNKTSKLSIDEERTVKVAAPPRGSRFKGYTNFVVQDLVIRPHVVNFRCERWLTPDGATTTAPLPAGITGHFGPELRRFVLAQYHQGQVKMPRLLTLLQALGIIISKRQLVRLLIAGQDDFLDEARDVLRARAHQCPLVHRGSPQGRQRILHADRQRPFCLVRHHRLQEPRQLPRTAARRSRRLRHQHRSAGPRVDRASRSSRVSSSWSSTRRSLAVLRYLAGAGGAKLLQWRVSALAPESTNVHTRNHGRAILHKIYATRKRKVIKGLSVVQKYRISHRIAPCRVRL